MIDLGLSKLAVIGIVTLVVIGPKHLPTAARILGALFGKAQRYIHQAKTEISQEIALDTLRNLQDDFALTKNSVYRELYSINNSVNFENSDGTYAHSITPKPKILPLLNSLIIKRQKKRISTWHYRQVLSLRKNLREQHLTLRLLSGAARVKRYRHAINDKKNFFGDF